MLVWRREWDSLRLCVSVLNRTGHGNCDYHAGAYEHAFWHVRLTARSNPTAISKKPIPSRNRPVFRLWRREWDSLRLCVIVLIRTVTEIATITPGPTNMPFGMFA